MALHLHWRKSNQQIKRDKGLNKSFYKAVAETCARYMTPYVPMQEGILYSTFDTDSDNEQGYVTYTSIYAHYQYEGISSKGNPLNYSLEQHPLATSHWDKAMYNAKKKQLTTELNELRRHFTQ